MMLTVMVEKLVAELIVLLFLLDHPFVLISRLDLGYNLISLVVLAGSNHCGDYDIPWEYTAQTPVRVFIQPQASSVCVPYTKY